MTEHIDHAAEARTTIVEMGYPLSNADLIAHAQVHATLALVEQQRLANVIAVATWNVGALRSGARRDGEPADVTAEHARIDAMFAEVREGLGL